MFKQGLLRRDFLKASGGLGMMLSGGCTSARRANNAFQGKKTRLLSPDDLGWTKNNIYWPSLIRASNHITNPINEYYLYFSEDHTQGSQIGLATAPTPAGPFTDHGPVFRDPESSSQTETPSLIYNDSTEKLYMYYHGNYSDTDGSNQKTALATSSEGLNWSKYGIVISVPPSAPGDGHTGYFRPRKLNGRWHGYHLVGGTSNPTFGWSWSDDGKDWTTSWPLSHGNDLLGRNDLRIEWSHSNLHKWRDNMFWIGSIAPYSSGRITANSKSKIEPDRTISISRIDPESNYTRLADQPRPLIKPTEPWETDTIRTPDLYIEGDILYIYYTVNRSIAVAEFDYPSVLTAY